jgi:hypothetical protein
MYWFRWTFTVFLFPGALFTLVLADYLLHRDKGTGDALKGLQGNVFFVAFFCYPSMCNMLFSAFLCVPKGATCTGKAHPSNEDRIWLHALEHAPLQCSAGDLVTESVLVMDDRVLCEEKSHHTLQYLSAALICK